MGYATHSDKVLKIITANPGTVIYRDDIAEDTGLTLDQVTVAMRRVLSDKESAIVRDLDVIIRGRAWAYHPNRTAVIDTPTKRVKVTPVEEPVKVAPALVASPRGETLEKTGKTAAGEIVVRDEKGTLFKVVPL